jgi:hypothetical protein
MGRGVVGVNNSGAGGNGVYGQSSGGHGVYGQDLAGGDGIYGFSTGGSGVYGDATGSGSVGIYGISNSGSGVSGQGGTSGNGVFGQTAYSSGAGVSGYNNGGAGYGIAGTASGTGYAVYGNNSSSNGYAGFFNGNVYVANTLSCGVSCNSDIRLKQNVKPLDGAIDQLLQLRGVTFEWKNPAEHENHTGVQRGLIAQEVEKVFPQWVHETPDTGVKNVDPDARTVLALEVESIRTLSARNEALEARIQALEANRRPLISGLTAEGTLFGFGFVGMSCAFFVSRRKRSESGRQG